MTEQTKWWTIKTYYKKSCEQIEYFRNRSNDGVVTVRDGYRYAEYRVETDDGEFPDIDFTEVPGGNGQMDSIDLNSCFGSNVESTELVEMYDGGCWGDIAIEGIDDEDEVARLEKLINEEGSYALEDYEDSDWYLDETEVWVWGPLEISDDAGNTRIVMADPEGNMIDFKEE